MYFFNASTFQPIFGSSAIPRSDVDVQRKKRHSLLFKNGSNDSIVFLIPLSESSVKQTVLINPALFQVEMLIAKLINK
jgi:hypothetical protein